MVTPLRILVLVLAATSGATEPIVSESEHHVQFVVFRCLYDVI